MFLQLYSNYGLALWFFGAKITAQKLLKKCWWNGKQVSKESSSEVIPPGINKMNVDINWHQLTKLPCFIKYYGILKDIKAQWQLLAIKQWRKFEPGVGLKNV